MEKLTTFKNQELSIEVRAIQINNTEMFIASDVAKALGYKNISDAVSRHCRGVVKHDTLDCKGIKQEYNTITEGDMYRLIIRSKLPSAVRFERWIMDEVLPALRKDKTYLADNASEEQIQHVRENKILQMINDSVRVGKAIKVYGKTITPDELKTSLVYIYDKLPSEKRAKFLRNVIINVTELKNWYRKSDDIEDFNSVTYERYNVVLLYLIRESEKFVKRSSGQKLGYIDKKLIEIQSSQTTKMKDSMLDWAEDFRVKTAAYAGNNYKKPARSAKFSVHKLVLSIGVYKRKNDDATCVYISDGVSFRRYGTLHPDENILNLAGMRVSYDFETNEIIIYKPTIVYENN